MALAPVPFPPPPRTWRSLVDAVVEHLSAASAPTLPWAPVQLAGLDEPWIGVAASPGTGERPWVWDVVTPDDHRREAGLHDDPLTIPVEQDVVVVDVVHPQAPGSLVRLQVPVTSVPTRIDLTASRLPPPPWRLELATGWTAAAIANAVHGWIGEWVGRDVALVCRGQRGELPGGDCGAPASPPALSEDRFEVGEDLWVSSAAFDQLLAVGVDDAAQITGALSAVAEALAPYR